MSEFWQLLQLSKWSNFALFYLFRSCLYLSEDLSWCFSNVVDALICRANVLLITFSSSTSKNLLLLLKVVRNFFGGVGRFNNNVLFLKYECYSFLESYWITTNVNYFQFLFSFYFLCWYFHFVKILSILWISKNLLIFD